MFNRTNAEQLMAQAKPFWNICTEAETPVIHYAVENQQGIVYLNTFKSLSFLSSVKGMSREPMQLWVLHLYLFPSVYKWQQIHSCVEG